jgi:hypothetical protein
MEKEQSLMGKALTPKNSSHKAEIKWTYIPAGHVIPPAGKQTL